MKDNIKKMKKTKPDWKKYLLKIHLIKDYYLKYTSNF